VSYKVKEIFYSLQGEGTNSGRPAVICRLSGCNLWSGREQDRQSAQCLFCDTDFVGTDGHLGGSYPSASALIEAVSSCWPVAREKGIGRLVVMTGGEPLLQLDHALLQALHTADFHVAVETNGTLPGLPGIDYLTVSPKAGTRLVLRTGFELKIVYPQPRLDPQDYADLQFEHFIIQPRAGPEGENNQVLAMRFCLENPQWRLSLQLHKLLGLQ